MRSLGMALFSIGMVYDLSQEELEATLSKASSLGVTGIQLTAVSGEFSPENLSKERRKEILETVKGNGMRISAVNGDFGMGFFNRRMNPLLIEKTKRIFDLAKDWECDVVTTHIGVVPKYKSEERYRILQDACYELARSAWSQRACLAVETGPETAMTLKVFLDGLGSRGIGVNFNPAALLMIAGDDPIKAVHTLSRYIVHAYANDGRMLRRTKPEYLYGVYPMPKELARVRFFEEMPLGTGGVSLPNYLQALSSVEYHGFLTVKPNGISEGAIDLSKVLTLLNSYKTELI